MSESTNLDTIRVSALDQIDRAERRYKLAWFAVIALESMFLLGFVLLADLSNRLHVLLLLSTVAIYSILGAGLVALGAHVNKSTKLILRAIDSLSEK